MLNTLVNGSLIAIYYLILAIYALLFLECLYLGLCRSKRYCQQKIFQERIEFLMTGDYQKLLKHARKLGLVTRAVKKDRLCHLIAVYQLSNQNMIPLPTNC